MKFQHGLSHPQLSALPRSHLTAAVDPASSPKMYEWDPEPNASRAKQVSQSLVTGSSCKFTVRCHYTECLNKYLNFQCLKL